MARTALPPAALRSMATPMRMTDGCVVANSQARVRMSSAERPEIPVTRSGLKLAARAFRSS